MKALAKFAPERTKNLGGFPHRSHTRNKREMMMMVMMLLMMMMVMMMMMMLVMLMMMMMTTTTMMKYIHEDEFEQHERNMMKAIESLPGCVHELIDQT